MAMLKLCRCGRKIDYRDKHCKECAKAVEEERKKYYRHYDAYHRDRESAAFYNSTEWQRVRQHVLIKYKGLDLYAYYIDKEIVYADTVHHIIEIKDDWNKRLTVSNLFPCSSSNHNKIHMLYNKNKKENQKTLFKLLKRWEEEHG